MKTIIFILSPLLLLLACNSAKKDQVRAFIPGTYVRFSDHEMRTEYDTIRIEVMSEMGSNYRLMRSSYFQKKLDGQMFPWEYRLDHWTGIYDDNTKILKEDKNGKVISFLPAKNSLMVGTTEYKKIK